MKITKLRKSLNLTQTQLAQMCGTTQQQIAKLENGLVDPKLTSLRRISEALRCELPDLFWTRKEFVSEINRVISIHDLDLKKNSLIDLNIICSKESGIPDFHPYWELIKINKSKNLVILK